MEPAGPIADRAYAPKPGAPARPAIVREARQQLAGEKKNTGERYLHKIGNTTVMTTHPCNRPDLSHDPMTPTSGSMGPAYPTTSGFPCPGWV